MSLDWGPPACIWAERQSQGHTVWDLDLQLWILSMLCTQKKIIFIVLYCTVLERA